MDREQRFLQIFYTYREVNQAFYHVVAKVAQRHGLTPLQLIVLRILEEFPDIRLAELSEKLNLGNSTASGIVDRMTKAGLVIRERAENDRRAMMLRLSEKGLALWEESNMTRTKLLRPLMSLSDEDQEHLLRIQHRMIQILKNISEDDLHD
ncbi:MarR family winged helix-turn-helix transcriptional regulator [Paenibacillus sp. GCM10023248]|uniref:MarR family winged helix-turn-helix transcriptional regulator n=1 Tax=Bacillales TaxID=1385 RepID=UPI002378A1AF|nr:MULTISPECIES: MarR family transcriptional regulator [Bacillales]MDD9270592.1 MarR family transcriptional regulator [Paenibacillus sp. MAHUQ-63]MDR6884739.1 DNA-binding MarR family transcriptional regulator [Bacillus sp. 3255]